MYVDKNEFNQDSTIVVCAHPHEVHKAVVLSTSNNLNVNVQFTGTPRLHFWVRVKEVENHCAAVWSVHCSTKVR